MALSKIEWTDFTFNPWSGCTKISAGCQNCYAAALPPSMRRGAVWGPNSRVLATDAYWKQPLAWNRKAQKEGRRSKVFCASTADVFEALPELDAQRDRLFELIKVTPHLDWLLLTKRPSYAVEYSLRRNGGAAWPVNAWIGTSVEDQRAANARIPHLLQVPAKVRFLSCEPLLGAVDLTDVRTVVDDLGRDDTLHYNALTGDFRWEQAGEEGSAGDRVHWVIVGGESGRSARPMHPGWASSLRDQCIAANVPFFFKQWGEWIPQDEAHILGDEDQCKILAGKMPTMTVADGFYIKTFYRAGKAITGRMLVGREWDGQPTLDWLSWRGNG